MTLEEYRQQHFLAGLAKNAWNSNGSIYMHSCEGTMLIFTRGTHDGEVIEKFLGKDLYHTSLSPEEYRIQLGNNGFDIIDHIEIVPYCERTKWFAKSR